MQAEPKPAGGNRRAGFSGVEFYFGRNLFIVVPQTGHLPLAALRLFLVVTISTWVIMRLVLHFTQ